jgi:signal peptidase I
MLVLETPEERVELLKAGISDKTKKNPMIAAVLSFLIPGFGQIYSGEVRKGLGIFLIGAIFTVLDIFLIKNNDKGMELEPALVVGIVNILFLIFIVYDAYKIAKETDSQI